MKMERKTYLDAVKILAILMVIFIHTQEAGFLAFQYQGSVLLQMMQTAVSVLCKIAVPLFLMCSGSLLLGKEDTLADLWKKRIFKYVLVIILFTLLYYIFVAERDHSPIDLLWIIKTMYVSWSFSYSGAYWFLYTYVGFLIALPILRIIAKNMTSQIMMYIIALNVLVNGILLIVELFLHMERIGIPIPLLVSDVFVYPMLGYCIEFKEKGTKEQEKKSLRTAGILALLCIAFSSVLTMYCTRKGNMTQKYINVFGIFLTAYVFLLIKYCFSHYHVSERTSRLLSAMGSCTFGIYLIHGIIMTLFDDVITATGIVKTYSQAWLETIIVFLIGCSVIFLCRKIPVLRKLL